MARKSTETELTIAELQRLLNVRQRELNGLMNKRQRLQAKLDELDKQIAGLGSNGVTGGGRARNATSLIGALESVLRDAGGPLKVGDIVNNVLKTGYQSTSANFRGIVNQTLIKDKRFQSAGRGMYQMKK